MADFKLVDFSVRNVIPLGAGQSIIPDNISMIQAPSFWAKGCMGEGQVVAVIDTGVAPHIGIVTKIIDGKNFTSENSGDTSNYRDTNGHGTHVAGTIVDDICGVAPNAKILAVKVLDKDGNGNYMDIVSGIRYAMNWRGPNGEKVSVISMSLGGPTDFALLRYAIKDAVANNILVVCAAGNIGDGNSDTDEYSYPGAYPEVVEVAACNGYAEAAFFSNSNAEIDLMAPGVGIVSTYLNGQYKSLSGTSMATPHVSGAACLLKQEFEATRNRPIMESELYAQLVKHTTYVANIDRKQQGNGLLFLITDAPNRTLDEITVEEAVKILNFVGIIDTPEFWLNLVDKFESNPQTYDDFRYVGLLIRKIGYYLS